MIPLVPARFPSEGRERGKAQQRQAGAARLGTVLSGQMPFRLSHKGPAVQTEFREHVEKAVYQEARAT